jgi:CRP-like cAMP-binding protein
MLTQTAVVTPFVVTYRTGARHSFRPIEKPVRLFGGTEKTFGPNEELFGEGESADHIYKMVRGTVRSYKSLGGGRRKIEAFRLRGDVFGLEAGKEREFCAEAVDEVSVLITRRMTVVGATIDCEAVQELWAATARELQRVQRHALLLAMNARQRVACFLLEMSRRLGEPDVVELPMSRQDIADYLGLTIETVSRTITRFEAKGLVWLPTSRQIVLRDRGALRRMNE